MPRRSKWLQFLLQEGRPETVRHRLCPKFRSERLPRKQEEDTVHPRREIGYANQAHARRADHAPKFAHQLLRLEDVLQNVIATHEVKARVTKWQRVPI